MIWPEDRLSIPALGKLSDLAPQKIVSVRMLGREGKVKSKRTKDALVVKMPEEKPCEHAYVLEIVFEEGGAPLK